KRTIGAELAKDLDAAYRNVYLCAAAESGALEVSMRIHADAWYDAQNLSKRLKAEGTGSWIELLNALEGFRLRLPGWWGGGAGRVADARSDRRVPEVLEAGRARPLGRAEVRGASRFARGGARPGDAGADGRAARGARAPLPVHGLVGGERLPVRALIRAGTAG